MQQDDYAACEQSKLLKFASGRVADAIVGKYVVHASQTKGLCVSTLRLQADAMPEMVVV